MGTTRQKKAAPFDLFQGPPSGSGADPQTDEGLDSLFERPPGAPPHPRAKKRKAPEKPSVPDAAEGFDSLFERPPGAPTHPRHKGKKPKAPEKTPEKAEGFDSLFERPPGAPPHPGHQGKKPKAPEKPPEPPKAETPPPPPKAPTPAPPAPPRAPTPPPRPKTPAPAPQPPAPPAPAPAPGQLPATGDLRKMREFREFVKEKYQAGEQLIRHPEPRPNRREYVKFWYAFKFPAFREKVKREFELWRQEKEAQRPRLNEGDRIRSLDGLRVGDVIGRGRFSDQYKVTKISPKSIVVVRVDRNGRPFGKEKRMQLRSLQEQRFALRPPVIRQDIGWDSVSRLMDKHQFVPRSVTNAEQYRGWVENLLKEESDSPFYRLGEDESARVHEVFKKHVDRVLRKRDIDKDWTWQAPTRAQVGKPVVHPLQVQPGDFIEDRYGHKIRVIQVDDDKLKGVKVTINGAPMAYGEVEYSPSRLKQQKVKRVEPVQRPEIPYRRFEKFINAVAAAPPKAINSQSEYRNWLLDKVRLNIDSPYRGLGADEHEHQNALKKQIDRLLKERGVGPDWTWEPPAHIAKGQRVRSPHQLRVGDFVDVGAHNKLRVMSIGDDGHIQVIPIGNHGLAEGGAVEITPKFIKDRNVTRADEIRRPDVPDDIFQRWADKFFENAPDWVSNADQYRAWMERKARHAMHSPYFAMANESAAERAMKRQIDQVLKDRGIDKSWTHTPKPLITFPAEPHWEEHQDQLLDIATRGVRQGKDKPLGDNSVNSPVRREMQYNGRDQKFIFKSKHKEPGQPGSGNYRGGQLPNKTGIPSGEMHNREKGAYQLDRLLGDGMIVPVTTSTGKGPKGLGAYQQWIDGMQTFAEGGEELHDIPTEDLLRHPDVGRQLVLDVLMGHQDRHYGNMAFSWIDPNGPKTAENLRLHAIDNGYALAASEDGQKPANWDIRDHWIAATNRQDQAAMDERAQILERYFTNVPDAMREKLKGVSTKQVATAMAQSGITDPSVAEAAAVRLAVMQANPDLLGDYIAATPHGGGYPPTPGSARAQQRFQYESHHRASDLLQRAGIDASRLDEIKKEVREALKAAA